jgi:hypothetical protein
VVDPSNAPSNHIIISVVVICHLSSLSEWVRKRLHVTSLSLLSTLEQRRTMAPQRPNLFTFFAKKPKKQPDIAHSTQHDEDNNDSSSSSSFQPIDIAQSTKHEDNNDSSSSSSDGHTMAPKRPNMFSFFEKKPPANVQINNANSIPTEPEVKDFQPTDDDLLGRGGRSNHHKGNRWYLEEKENIHPRYRAARAARKQEKKKANASLGSDHTPEERAVCDNDGNPMVNSNKEATSGLIKYDTHHNEVTLQEEEASRPPQKRRRGGQGWSD